uniref:TGS domain-containing protein n=1 Tax=Romanomermis culicivorax TaxID=13658 RepID=A0A915IGE3_ROMCU
MSSLKTRALKCVVERNTLSIIRRFLVTCNIGNAAAVDNTSFPLTADIFQKTRLGRSDIFSAEKERQRKLITKINKIEVNVVGPTPKLSSKLMMNKSISTPVDCALHVNESLTKYPALALVNNKPWDMNRPLEEDCQLKYLFYTDADPKLANQAYWRSCSFILGYILEIAFKENFRVLLHSWPSSNFHSGSFVYDSNINVGDWSPSNAELKSMSRVPTSDLRTKNLRFEPLSVDASVAEKIFESNQFKLEQIKLIARNNNKVPLYRLGDHVDISKGPMIAHTGQLGIYSLTAMHKYESDFGPLVRFQGVSVPFTQFVNSWTWEVTCRAAKNMQYVGYFVGSVEDCSFFCSSGKEEDCSFFCSSGKDFRAGDQTPCALAYVTHASP